MRRRGGRREAERAGLVGARQQQRDVGGRGERARRARRDGDQRNAEARVWATMSASSGVSPELDSATARHPRRDHAEIAVAGLGRDGRTGPAFRSRPGSRRSCGATWPLLPMPVTTTRPVAAPAGRPPREAGVEAVGQRRRPSASTRSTRRATARSSATSDLQDRARMAGFGDCRHRDLLAAAFRHEQVLAGARSTPIGAEWRSGPGGGRPIGIVAEQSRHPSDDRQCDGRRRRPARVNARRCPDSAQPARSSAARVGRKREAGLPPGAVRPSRASIASSSRPERVQVQHVGGGVAQLLLAQFRRAPVRSSAAASTDRRRAAPCTGP